MNGNNTRGFLPVLTANIGSCSKWKKYYFPQFQEKILNSKNKKIKKKKQEMSQ